MKFICIISEKYPILTARHIFLAVVLYQTFPFSDCGIHPMALEDIAAVLGSLVLLSQPVSDHKILMKIPDYNHLLTKCILPQLKELPEEFMLMLSDYSQYLSIIAYICAGLAHILKSREQIFPDLHIWLDGDLSSGQQPGDTSENVDARSQKAGGTKAKSIYDPDDPVSIGLVQQMYALFIIQSERKIRLGPEEFILTLPNLFSRS